MNDAIEPAPRCSWPGDIPIYIDYHDEEWGVPEWDSQALFEKLLLDGFQAGLSWITILRKREAFREVFEGFDPEVIANFSEIKLQALLQDKRIVRNRAKIYGSVTNAQAYLELTAKEGSFADYLWGFVDGQPIQNQFERMDQVPAETPLSKAISKDLKKRGFKFCGPTIVYAFMQAVGMVNDHVTTCFRHEACRKLAQQKP